LLTQIGSTESIKVDYFMKLFRSDEEAVSPVIGVILMVAIVVILAAVIAAFVFGMAGNVQTTKTVGVTVAQTNNSSMMQTFQGGKDAALVMDLTSKVTPSDGSGEIVEMWDTPLLVGDTHITNGPNPGSFSGRDHVVVVANFTDGSTQVVLDTYT
jgi:flagellin-like protein